MVNSRIDVHQIRPPGCTVQGEDRSQRASIRHPLSLWSLTLPLFPASSYQLSQCWKNKSSSQVPDFHISLLFNNNVSYRAALIKSKHHKKPVTSSVICHSNLMFFSFRHFQNFGCHGNPQPLLYIASLIFIWFILFPFFKKTIRKTSCFFFF